MVNFVVRNGVQFSDEQSLRPQQQERTFDALIAELTSGKLSAHKGNLLSRVYSLKKEIADFLTDDRAAQIEQLEEQLDAAIIAARKAKQAFSLASQATFKAQQVYVKLDSAYENALRLLTDLQSASDRDALTRAERVEHQEKIAKAQAKVHESEARANEAHAHANLLMATEQQAVKSNNEAVNLVTDLQKQIDRLSK